MTFFSSIRFKISILYTAVLGLILLAYSTLLYVNLQYVIYTDIDKELLKKASAIEKAIEKYSQILEPDHETVMWERHSLAPTSEPSSSGDRSCVPCPPGQ